MKELIGQVDLYNRGSKSFDRAQVYRELDKKNFDDLEQLWKPILANRLAQVHTLAEAANVNVQDAHWDWVGKAKIATTQMGQETFVIECGETQCLMLVDLNQFAQLDMQKGRELIYVELLATAPWNRHKLVASPRYKGVGRILIATAISLSIDSGFHGRIGLHSLPQSESWYREGAGFTDMGLDGSKRMNYFEVTADQAKVFLEDN